MPPSIGTPLLCAAGVPALNASGQPTYYAGSTCPVCSSVDPACSCPRVYDIDLTCYNSVECGESSSSDDDVTDCDDGVTSLCCHRVRLVSNCCDDPTRQTSSWGHQFLADCVCGQVLVDGLIQCSGWTLKTDDSDENRWALQKGEVSPDVKFSVSKSGRCPGQITIGEWNAGLILGECEIEGLADAFFGTPKIEYYPIYLCGKIEGIDDPDFVYTFNPPCLRDTCLYPTPPGFLKIGGDCYFRGSLVEADCPPCIEELICKKVLARCEAGYEEIDSCAACDPELCRNCEELHAILPATITADWTDYASLTCPTLTSGTIPTEIELTLDPVLCRYDGTAPNDGTGSSPWRTIMIWDPVLCIWSRDDGYPSQTIGEAGDGVFHKSGDNPIGVYTEIGTATSCSGRPTTVEVIP